MKTPCWWPAHVLLVPPDADSTLLTAGPKGSLPPRVGGVFTDSPALPLAWDGVEIEEGTARALWLLRSRIWPGEAAPPKVVPVYSPPGFDKDRGYTDSAVFRLQRLLPTRLGGVMALWTENDVPALQRCYQYGDLATVAALAFVCEYLEFGTAVVHVEAAAGAVS